MKFNAKEIKEIINYTNFKSFQDYFNPFRLFQSYGIFKGDKILKWLEQIIAKKGLKPTATFKDFKESGFLNLCIFSTDLNEKNIKKFSFETTPNVVLVEAIRASISIPLYFKAYKFKNNNPDDHLYIDGGVVYNYPLTAFDKNGLSNFETLGFHLDTLNKSDIEPLNYNHPFKYVSRLLSTSLKAQNVLLNNSSDDLKRTVKINDYDISVTDFNISNENKEKLYQSGIQYTNSYLNNYDNKI
jgi:NTE family protein